MTEIEIPLVDLAWQHSQIAEEVSTGWADIVDETAFVGGAPLATFERDFARYSGVEHCLGVGNGTDALELALRAAGIGSGDCIVPANSFVATAEAVVRAGGRLLLVDIDPTTFLIDRSAALELVSPRTAAVIPVHLYGRVAELGVLREFAQSRDVLVLDDAAQSQGARLLGDIAATSFYPGKNLGAYGDGGAVLTNSAWLAEQVKLLRSHGERDKYEHQIVGCNSRLDTLQAVVLAAKLRRLDDWNQLRREAAARYNELLQEVEQVVRPKLVDDPAGHVWHLYVVRVPNRESVLSGLRAEGIGAAVHYPTPIHLTPAFAPLGYKRGDFPHAERAAAEILSLPLFPGITEAQQERVAEVLIKLVR